MRKKDFLVIIICIIISIISGVISNDFFVGGTILLTGLLCAYFASEGKRINYVLGFINYLLMGYIAFKNDLFGIFLFYFFLFSPFQIYGFLSWGKNLNEDNSVKVRQFTFKNSLIIILFCLLGSVIFGYLLTFIPSQRLAFMDAFSNCVNLCGVMLMVLRFKESWWLWLLNNIIDLIIWMITVIHGGEGAIMMLLVSIGYLLINVYGIIKWSIETKKN